jgi:Fe-S-cluster containining protein
MPKSLADHVSERINAKAEQIRPMTPREHECAKVQCAFLVDGRCSVYPVRPMTCAAHHSADVAVCEAAFHRPTGQDDLIPQVANLVRSREAMQAAANQAMVNRNLKRQCIELHTALSALLRDPSLIGKWRSGRPLIKDATHVREES